MWRTADPHTGVRSSPPTLSLSLELGSSGNDPRPFSPNGFWDVSAAEPRVSVRNRREKAPERLRRRKVSGHKPRITELFGNLVDRTGDVIGYLSTGNDHLAGAEEEDDDFGIIEAVYKTGELFWLVFHFLETEGDRDGVEVDLLFEIGGGDDVLYFDHGLLFDDHIGLSQILYDFVDGTDDLILAFASGTDDLSAAE